MNTSATGTETTAIFDYAKVIDDEHRQAFYAKLMLHDAHQYFGLQRRRVLIQHYPRWLPGGAAGVQGFEYRSARH